MINEAPNSPSQSSQTNARLESMVEKLRTQLINLVVKDSQGQVVGEVKDVNLAADGQINLAISDRTNSLNSRLFHLRSKRIEKIDYATQTVFINLSRAQIEQLPEYRPMQPAEVTPSDLPPRPAGWTGAVPVQPATQLQDRTYEEGLDAHFNPESVHSPERVTEAEIRLLEERLVIDRSKHKVGEVIVRKEIETRIVEVPIRREKLIIEQVSPERKQLAEIDLGQGEITGLDLSDLPISDAQPMVKGEFVSPEVASQVLKGIAARSAHKCVKVRVEIVLEDSELQETYQELFNRYSDHP